MAADAYRLLAVFRRARSASTTVAFIRYRASGNFDGQRQKSSRHDYLILPNRQQYSMAGQLFMDSEKTQTPAAHLAMSVPAEIG
jgi:hypothetical protein